MLKLTLSISYTSLNIIADLLMSKLKKSLEEEVTDDN